jgi:hypothetical protein
MKIIKLFLFLFLGLYLFSTHGIAQQMPKDSICFEILLDDKEILKSFQDVSFIPSMNITSDGFILLSSPNQFYILGLGGMLPFSEKTETPVHSFTKTPDNAIMLIQEKNFCFLDSSGKIVKLFGLPDENLKISAGKEVLYLYGKNNFTDKDVIYILFKGAKYILLMEYPFPITSILETNENLFFSSKNKLLIVDTERKQINEFLSLSNENDEIISIDNDYVHGVLYFSTNSAVYRTKNNQIELFNDEFGGIIKYDGEGLVVFNPGKNLIVRFRNNILYSPDISIRESKKQY